MPSEPQSDEHETGAAVSEDTDATGAVASVATARARMILDMVNPPLLR